jgi:fructose-1,6-bisphosphatase/sedoheptulose 1,7-bisphosphatase-like protein
MGYDFDSVITMDDLVSSDDVFFAATGITDGELLEGVHYTTSGAVTESVVEILTNRYLTHKCPSGIMCGTI